MTSDKIKITAREIFSYIFSIILAIIFLYIAFLGVDFTRLLSIISKVSIFWIIIFILLTFIGDYLRAIRWNVIINSSEKKISNWNLFGALTIGYGVNNLIPRLGEVTRAVSVGQTEGLSKTTIFGTIIVERVIDIIFFGIAVILSALIYEGNLYSNFPWLQTTILIGTILILFAILLIVLTIKYKEKFSNIIISIIGKFSHNFAGQVGLIFEKLIDGFSSLKGFKNYSLTIILSVLIMFSYGINSYFGLYIIDDIAKYGLDLKAGWIIMSISSIGILIPTPGGIGSYHTITKAILVSLYGMNQELSMAYATITHALTYLLHIIGSIFFLFYFRKKFQSSFSKSLFKLNEIKE